MGDYFRFDSVFIKKSNQIEFFLKKPKPVQTDQFLFGFLGQKPVRTGLAWFFSVSVQFFWFRTYKTEPNLSVFSRFSFFGYFFRFNRFFSFFAHP
jgi:hypothetical protein